MSWTLLGGVVAVLTFALLVVLLRRRELARMARAVGERDRAIRQGAAEAQLQHPIVDLSRCLGCATCVAACPEDGVLELVHGQAMVVRGARCVGVAACERECPVGAIHVTLANVEERDDVPALTGELEAVGAPGLFLAGEVTAHALVKTAIEHGTAVARAAASRRAARPHGPELDAAPTLVARHSPALMTAGAPPARPPQDAREPTRHEWHDESGVLDLCIVGAGPAGLACSLEARRLGLDFVTLEQESTVGGTVAKYPRRKLVLSEPVELPLFGRLARNAYTKEELIALWQHVTDEHELPVRCDETLTDVEQVADGHFVVRTRSRTYSAHSVCLALGRRGSPNKLGIPGEELPKVAYSLLDAGSFEGRKVVVIGGGDAAVEAALGLAEQRGNEVTLSYRKDSFFRIRSRNAERLEEATRAGQLQVLTTSEVTQIDPGHVELALVRGQVLERRRIANDEVFVMAGGTPPIELLKRAGVSFDPSLRPAPEQLGEQGPGLVRALALALALALFTLAFAVWNRDYYGLSMTERPTHSKHDLLRPGMGLGLVFGVTAAALVGLNLLYLARRSPRVRLELGSLRAWMTSHVATGILAFLCALLHAAMAPRDTVGGHALLGLFALLLTGAVGRYLYAWVPRAANGRELELTEVKAQLGALESPASGARGKPFGERARSEVLALVHARQWKSTLVGRLLALVGVRTSLRRALARIEERGRAEGIDAGELQETVQLARRAHDLALRAAHYEDLRGVLSSWRYVHRWVAALMVLLVVLHTVHALLYGSLISSGGVS